MNQLPIRHCVLLGIGSLGPLGHLPASGTVTVAVAGIPFFLLVDWLEPPLVPYLVFVFIFTAASIALHDVGDRILGEKDSRKLVWDELAGFWVAIIAVPFTWQLAVIAFFLERAIDIAKIPPANWIEQRWPGGWGVVGDDIIAGLYTCGILHAAIHYFPNWVGL